MLSLGEIENCGVSMQRCRVMLLLDEDRGILMPRYEMMQISSENCGVSMQRVQMMLLWG